MTTVVHEQENVMTTKVGEPKAKGLMNGSQLLEVDVQRQSVGIPSRRALATGGQEVLRAHNPGCGMELLRAEMGLLIEGQA